MIEKFTDELLITLFLHSIFFHKAYFLISIMKVCCRHLKKIFSKHFDDNGLSYAWANEVTCFLVDMILEEPIIRNKIFELILQVYMNGYRRDQNCENLLKNEQMVNFFIFRERV